MAFRLWLMVLFSFWKTLFNSLFHLMSPAGSHFCSLFFGNVYSFEIFSIGNSARTRGKKKKTAWELSNCIVPGWTVCTYNFWRVREYLAHILDVQISSNSTTHSPIPFPVLKTGQWEIGYAKYLSHTVTWKANGKFRKLTTKADFQKFLSHFSLSRLTLNFVILYLAISF